MKSKTTSKKATSPHQPHHGNAADFEALLRTSMDEVMLKTNAHQEAWGLGEEEQWCLDEGSGELILSFPNSVTSAPAQVIGTFDTVARTWTWAWADLSLPDHLKKEAWQVRDYGSHHGFQHLLTASWQAEESHCWYMTALACHLCHARGAFRGVSGDKYLFLIFGDETITAGSDTALEEAFDPFMAEAAEEFKLCLENLDEQRHACLRYLKRGALAGVPQDQLIHRLGLHAPSVLDVAGYSSDQAENVMGMLKGITDDEISSCYV